ncbi:MAG: hypothetical protein EOO40_02365 [Deltaproteobacteria bacterium]|nr:MAG: hypothetical protein EOO40_02365 [Deltaproteobacteria bacterium]
MSAQPPHGAADAAAQRRQTLQKLAQLRLTQVGDAAAFQKFLQVRGELLLRLQALIEQGPPLGAEEQSLLAQAQQVAQQVGVAATAHLQDLGAQLRSVQAAQRLKDDPQGDTRGRLLDRRG